MKKLVSIIILCLGCFGFLEAQDNIWKLLNCDTPFLGAASNGDLFAMNEFGGLLRSQDEGETWTQVNENSMHQCIAFSPEGRIFVFPTSNMCLQFSDDGGDIWQATTTMASCAMYDVGGLCAPTNDIVVVWATNGETYWTTDGGETWDFAILEADDGSELSDMIVNAEGDVYVSVWSYSDGDTGIFHSTLSDMENWEIVAAEELNIRDMAFDPEGNVVTCGYHIDGSSIGYQHTPGFYLFDGTTLAISDGGIVYRPHFDGNQAVLSYSTDHGEHFTDIGEHLPLVDIAPGGDAYFLIKGHDNHLYFNGGGEYWKCIPDADEITNYGNYVPLVHEGNDRQKWNVVYIASMNYPNDYFTDVQSIRDNIILDGVDYKLAWVKNSSGINIAGAVREEDRRVYFRRKTGQIFQDEVLLYDFNLSMGDTVTVNWTGTPLVVIEESEVEVNGTTRRQLGLAEYSIGLYSQREVEEYWIEGVGSTYGFLNSGYEGWSGTFVHLLCYHENGDLVWDNEAFDDCVMNSDGAPATFAPQGAEWYFNLSSFMGSPFSYYHMEVLGDTIIQGHDCSIITRQFLDGAEPQYVYEENNKVYWYNQTLGRFTTLYDFDAEVGESWICEIDECSFEIRVDSIEEVTWEDHTYRVQHVTSVEGEYFYNYYGRIIEGIGSVEGLFPYPYACVGDIYDGQYPDWLRCYLVDGEMLYHGGDYECDEIVDVPYPSYPFAVGDLLYTIISDNPPQVSVYGHVNGDYAQGELDIPSTVTCEDVTYTVTEIGKWAFKNCSGLTGFAIPSTIDTIQEGAFYGCSGFTGTLDLSFTTAVLKKDVFRECSGFTELILPLFITEIPEGAFCGCSGLTGTLVLSESESLEIIGEGAFARCSGFTGLVLPNGLREIREQAFAGCTGFTGNLVIPETVTHIKYQAFGHCTGFSGDLVIPNSVVELGNTQNSSYYVNPEPYSTFADCFDHLVLSQLLDTIGPRCFAGCTRLTGDLVLPTGLKAVYAYAFQGCTGLTGLMINDSLTSIGSYAFSGCSGIRGTVTIPENVGVGMAAFEWCSGIEELVLPHHIVFQSNPDKGYVFQGCTSLTELDIPEGWTRIEKSSFAMCSNLLSVHLPESLTIIDGSSFSECTSLSEINIPEGVTEIGIGAFSKCSSLTHVELPASLRTLGGQAFADCTSLSGILVVPDLVQRIEMMTFRSCNQLDCIVLGDSINSIAEPAFQDTELDSLVIKAMTPPELRRMTTQGAWHFPDDLSIVVPCGTLEAYQNAEGWADFTNITENCDGGLIEFEGSEWYYEIQNENGSITYQYLESAADTTVNDKTVTIIIRTNTLYDKSGHTEVTHEYIYEENEVVYWWNKDLQEFAVLYDLGAEVGDGWEIKVGTTSLVMHVDAVESIEYEGRTFKTLQVSDAEDLFSGTIVCGIGHLTSFFPERLMNRGKGYRVEGIRCYWRNGELVFKYGDKDCDEVYMEYHNGIEETDEVAFAVYPNPTDGVLYVETFPETSPTNNEYRITNLMGQTVLTGSFNAETQQIDVSTLPQGMYFITISGTTMKFMAQ